MKSSDPVTSGGGSEKPNTEGVEVKLKVKLGIGVYLSINVWTLLRWWWGPMLMKKFV